MRRTHEFQFGLRKIVIAVVGAMMVACGGGGGPGPVQKLSLSLANRDAVSHAVIGGALGMGSADRAIAAANVAVALRRSIASVQTMRAHPLATYSQTFDCKVSGQRVETFDDRDNDGQLTVGDAVTVAYTQCSDTPGETLNGTASMEFTNALSSGFDARSSYAAFATEQQQVGQVHRYTLDGAMLLSYREVSSTQSTVTLTAQGDFTIGLLTPVFSDTVTLASGFVQAYADDTAALPPSGTGGPGRSTVTVTGDLHSVSAAGWVTVRTDAAMVMYAGDQYPREGSLHVSGDKGDMYLSAEPGSVHVQSNLDWNSDGVIEDTRQVTWDWLV